MMLIMNAKKKTDPQENATQVANQNKVNNFPAGMVFRGVESFESVTPNNSNPTPAPKNSAKQITGLMQTLEQVDTKSEEAKENAVSISDGKGGRIIMNDQVEAMKGVEAQQSNNQQAKNNDKEKTSKDD